MGSLGPSPDDCAIGLAPVQSLRPKQRALIECLVMEELLGAILAAVAELLFEFLFEVFVEALVALTIRSVRNLFSKVIVFSPILASAFYLLLGSAFGAVSLLLFPHPIFRPSKFHGISLLISPVVTGLAMSQVGNFLRRNDKQPVQIESFGYGFSFALGMAIVRFLFVR
jgi:hypothetical protein